MDNSQSIFDWITKLCEKHISKYQNDIIYPNKVTLKDLRSKCYEILLSKKRHEKCRRDDLENNTDPFCHLLAWQFQLMAKYNLPHHAECLRKSCDRLQELNVFNNPAYANVVQLLLQLRSAPKDDDTIMETTLDKNYLEDCMLNKSTVFTFFDESKFQLPVEKPVSQFENDDFKLHNKKVAIKNTSSKTVIDFLKSHFKNNRNRDDEFKNDDYELQSHRKEGNIWEFVSTLPITQRRTWENFGHQASMKEPPFLCESGLKPTTWLQNLSVSFENLIVDGPGLTHTIVIHQHFIKAVKYLLVGLESKIFMYNEREELNLVPGICVPGLSTSTIASYCQEFLLCSRCYQGLNNLCAPNRSTLKYIHNGYIFLELCKSIKRYLLYYRAAVLSLSDKLQLLMFCERTKQLRTHIIVLASVCKVGPFTEYEQIPHGVALLNYLYQKVMSLTDKDVFMVLYSVLYPCCQVYFSRFLHQWMLGGIVEDPYGEFFIQVNQKYVNSRGRTYWTRSYSLREDIVPDFINDLRADILLCGKAINLLKLCVPNSPICLYLIEKRPSIIACCIMTEQLASLEMNNRYYYLEASAVSGPRISLAQIVTASHERDDVFLSLIAKKRAATLLRIELERQKEAEIHFERKRKEMKVLREYYAEAWQKKRLKMADELEQEINSIEKDIRMQKLHDKIINEETNNLIAYYKELFRQSENRRMFFEKRAANLKKYHLGIENKRLDNERLQRNKTSPASHGKETEKENSDKSVSTASTSSLETFLSTYDDLPQVASEEYISAEAGDSNTDVYSGLEKQLDIVNANLIADSKNSGNQEELNAAMALENFQAAKRNKEKVLNSNYGFAFKQPKRIKNAHKKETITDAQKNKQKMMSSEFESNLTKNRQDETNEKPSGLTDAQRNKLKVMSVEFGYTEGWKTNNVVKDENNKNTNDDSGLTIAQKNKLKVMKSEFGYEVATPTNFKNKKPATILEINRNKVLKATHFYEYNDNADKTIRDNENYLNQNIVDNNSNISNKWASTKQDSLLLDFTKLNNNRDDHFKSPKFEKLSPMSIDSTPSGSITFDKPGMEFSPSSLMLTASTAAINYETGFNFEIERLQGLLDLDSRKNEYNLNLGAECMIFPKNITMREAASVTPNYLQLCLQQSISIPLITQMKLITNELLKYFINDLQYLKHLNSLRNYFFLLDGEFGRNITEGLFEKLYDANVATELINCRTLQFLMHKALDYSTKFQHNSSCLSFKINNLPKVFHSGDPDIFDCISLTYKATWPLNVLLPSDTIARYDEVFKFLLKLHRVSWVLQNVFQSLKLLIKEHNSYETMLSPQYRRLHQCRHVMTHFMQTLQSYVVGEVLQSSWEIFEKNLQSVTNFDQLYSLHTSYIKNILFMCLLNQKSAPLKKTLQNIFVVILKFYDYLRSQSWVVKDGVCTHPNFNKLEDIFVNFEELTKYLYKVGQKVVKSGYQPHLMQLLTLLDINKYYSNRHVPISPPQSSISFTC